MDLCVVFVHLYICIPPAIRPIPLHSPLSLHSLPLLAPFSLSLSLHSLSLFFFSVLFELPSLTGHTSTAKVAYCTLLWTKAHSPCSPGSLTEHHQIGLLYSHPAGHQSFQSLELDARSCVPSTLRAVLHKLQGSLSASFLAQLGQPRLDLALDLLGGAPTSLAFQPCSTSPNLMGGVNPAAKTQLRFRFRTIEAHTLLHRGQCSLAASQRNLGPAPFASKRSGTDGPPMALNFLIQSFTLLHQSCHCLLQSQSDPAIALCGLFGANLTVRTASLDPFAAQLTQDLPGDGATCVGLQLAFAAQAD